ncbi:MAG: peroxiredoxin family protein [Gaiellaceae bacterium]
MSVPWIIAFVALSFVVLIVGLLVVGIQRRLSTVLEAAEAVVRLSGTQFGAGGLPAGSVVPNFEAYDEHGQPISSAVLLAEPAIVVFLASDCEPCHRLVAELSVNERVSTLGVDLVIVLSAGDVGLRLPERDGLTVVSQRDREVANAFDTKAAPHAFAVGAERTIVASGTPNSFGQLEQLALRLRKGGDAEHSADRRIVHA